MIRRRLAALALAGAVVGVSLSGCAPAPQIAASDVIDDGSACYPPLACGPFYPTPVYPWTLHPYMGYIVNPAHTLIVIDHGRPRVTYRPYSPPIQPRYIPVPKPPQQQQKPAPAKQAPAPPKPAAPKPAPAPPRPATKAGK
ncbi:membrane protein [Arthrobacter phage Mufasa8]|uniref:Membrane protein n=1 Tax=Arthrobacter phage Mufasa8 TaxID=2656526 RepID=A0A649VM93_9CAUD|nr:membrane protein [Arthrobacter phage Mufasa8]QGJ93526.1 membrane protein [Arthrobacter phage Mufasa8]